MKALDNRQRTSCHCAVDLSIDPDYRVTDENRIDTIQVLAQYGADMVEMTSDSRESAKDVAIRYKLSPSVVMALEHAMRFFSQNFATSRVA